MKYVVLLGDGMADDPCPDLGGETPLQVAHTPNMDDMVISGFAGGVSTIPEGMEAGSDVANLSIMGYDPVKYYSGRAPLEAASLGVELAPDDVAFRCNLVTLSVSDDVTIMDDHSSGHISTQEGTALIEGLRKELESERIKFFPGKSYRHLTVWKGGIEGMALTPPHDILSQPVADYLPKGEGSDLILGLMEHSRGLLKGHPVNLKRKENGKNCADSIWLWGCGKAPNMPSFQQKYGMGGAVVSGVDLIKGLGRCLGLQAIEVPGATGYLDTNYQGKVDYGLETLRNGGDYLYLHVEAPDEAGHEGDPAMKVRAVEDFDKLVVGPMLHELAKMGEYRALVLPDHKTPLSIRTHSADPVPFAIRGTGVDGPGGEAFDERLLTRADLIFMQGHELLDFFFNY